MKKLLVAALLLVPALALSQSDYPRDLTISWTNASQYEDGTFIEAGDLTEVRIECTRNNDSIPAFAQTVAVNGEGQSQTATFTSVVPNPGTYSCVGYSIIFDGTESVASGATIKKFTGKPLPPEMN